MDLWSILQFVTTKFHSKLWSTLFLGYLVVGRASPLLSLSSSTTAYFKEHPEDHPVTIFIYLLQQVVIWNLILHFLDVRSIISQWWNINSSQHVVDYWVLERDETHMTKLQSRLDLWIKEKTLVVHGNVWAEAGQLYYSQVFSLLPLGNVHNVPCSGLKQTASLQCCTCRTRCPQDSDVP